MFPILFSLSACFTIPDKVLLTGVAYDGWEDDSEPLAGATLTSRDASLEVVDEVEADSDGVFEIEVGASQAWFLVVDADGFAPTAVSGLVGSEDITADDRAVWARSDDDLDEIIEDFAGCATSDGAVVEGDVRFWIPASNPVDTWPVVTTATVTAQYSNDVITDACYLDDDGVSDPEATVTGETGRFGIFGLESGLITVKVEAELTDDLTKETLYLGWLPEGGVLPLYSALIAVE